MRRALPIATLALTLGLAAPATAAPKPTTKRATTVAKTYAANVRAETETTRTARAYRCDKRKGKRVWDCVVRIECLDDYVKAITLRVRPLKSQDGRLGIANRITFSCSSRYR